MCLESILKWVANTLVLMIIAYIVPGVQVASFYTALVVALVLALINAVIKPILIFLTLPINILTLGLFTLIINGFLFWFASSIVKGFTISNFWVAVLAALIYSIFSLFISSLGQKREV
jgi:putative membrane protein